MMRSSVFRAGVLIAALGLMLGACSSDNNNNPDSGTPDGGHADSGTPDSGTPDSGTPDAGTHYDVTILHTNDLHSYMNSQGPILDYSPLTANDDATIGGFARLAARIDAERTAAGSEPVLLLDSGDFTMGTLFQTLELNVAPELSELGKMGYDAITFGNHEFDFTSAGLAAELNAAATGGFNVPIVASNIQFDANNAGDDALAAFQSGAGGAPKLIVSKVVKTLSNGLKVGIFGMMGKDAVSVAPLAKPVTFADQKTTAQAMVAELRNTDHVDLVVLLSHGGSHPDGTGEDVDLATAVPGIDIIISGHTHDAIPQPLHPSGTNTLIVQSGAYGSNLGELKVTYTKGGSSPGLALGSYHLIPLDDSVTADSATQTRIDGYISDINTGFQPAGLTYAQVVAETPTDVDDLQFQESPMGDLVTDAYLNVAQEAQTAAGLPLAVAAIEVGGNIRTSLKKGATGKVTFADLYRVTPLGASTDGQPGYPLVSFYLNGQDIKAGLEFAALAKDKKNDDYFIQMSGMKYKFSQSGPVTGRVESASINGTAVNFADASTCYQFIATQYVASLLGLVSTGSQGLLVVTPKEADCTTPITDFSSHIIDQDPGTAGVQQLHQWQAVLKYVTSFPDTSAPANGIPDIVIPDPSAEQRITIDP